MCSSFLGSSKPPVGRNIKASSWNHRTCQQACLHIASLKSPVAFWLLQTTWLSLSEASQPGVSNLWASPTPGPGWSSPSFSTNLATMDEKHLKQKKVKVREHYMRWNIGKWIEFRSLMNLGSIQAENWKAANQAHYSLGSNTARESHSSQKETSRPIPFFQVLC